MSDSAQTATKSCTNCRLESADETFLVFVESDVIARNRYAVTFLNEQRVLSPSAVPKHSQAASRLNSAWYSGSRVCEFGAAIRLRLSISS
ncbi:hypothetical protein NQZ68_036316 [Dissostichus eleginoides]|nr:hypothetical protein NQZ68_036316 [Dissostichus eleginoides]